MKVKYPERLELSQLPTPIHHLKRFSKNFGDGVKIYIKRDDLTGLELTGNKIRKLEFLLADAIKNGCDTILTYGSIQSNHCRATAAACAKLGLKCKLILRTPPPDKPYDGNLLLDELLGAEISFIPREEFVSKKSEILDRTIKQLSKKGRKVYYFPVGGSIPLGCWGYIKCFEEIIKQSKSLCVKFDRIFCALGSGGTQTGLILGRELFDAKETHIWGVNVCDDEEYFRKEITNLLDETINVFNLKLRVEDIPINIIDGYIGKGYTIPYNEEIQVIKDLAATEGIVLDITYTGKAFYGMLEQIKKKKIKKGETILFIHTGGIFDIFPQKNYF